MERRSETFSQLREKVICSIDFGTSGTAFTYAFINSKDDILSPEETKEPTEIILDSKMKCLAFGKECRQFLSSGKKFKQKYYHFTDIKMRLYKNERKIRANNDNSNHDLQQVISLILLKVKEQAIKKINEKRTIKIKDCDIEWKLTVPAIWREKSKEIMINAAKNARIFNEKSDDKSLFLALEPECAALDFINEKSSDKDAVKIGNNYIVCDIGGGTIDISTHTRKKNFINKKIYIEELYPPSGGNKGSTYINKTFLERVIKAIFGEDTFNELLNKIKNNSLEEDEEYEDYMQFLEQIEDFKIGINHNCSNDTKRINCTIFKNFVNEDISELIENYNSSCPEKWKINRYNGFKIHFPYQIMIDLTREIIVDNTVNYIYEIIDHVKNINSIIYAGSVSKNSYVISMIQNQLPNNINHCVTPHPVLAVARGAVMFGMDPLMINSRVARFNIGIRISENWNDLKHWKRKDLKYFCTIENKYKCSNIFSPIILKNKKLTIDNWVSKHYSLLDSNCNIAFMKTDYDDALFTDDSVKQCEKFGEIKFDAGKEYDESDKDLIVQLKLGGTFIDAKVIYKEVEQTMPLYFND